MDDEPLQIVNFIPKANGSDEYEIKILQDNLNHVLQTAGDLPLATICICGPSRQGKSFLLSHMVRCLTALENDDSCWMDWSNPDKPLSTGFKWQNSYGPVTKGMWLWSRPFIITKNRGKIAVLLIDTQGTYDEFSAVKETTTIVGLSLLMSSVMIFNFFTNLQEDILESLSNSMEFGLSARNNDDEDNPLKPFQNIMFLIRDWNNPGEFPYGHPGGVAFLEKKLEIKPEQPQTAQDVRRKVRQSFEKLDCYLMPLIGEQALSPSYDGRISSLNLAFALHLEKFLKYITGKELVEKRILGNKINATDFSALLHKYVEAFNNDQFSSDATSSAMAATALNKSVERYSQQMQEAGGGNYLSREPLMEVHEQAECDALFFFKNLFQTFGKLEEVVEKLEDELSTKIDEEFRFIRAQNEEKRRVAISATIEVAKNLFNEALAKFEVDDDNPTIYDEDDITNQASRVGQAAKEELTLKLSQELNEEVAKMITLLETEFQQKLDSILAKNFIKKQKAAEAQASSIQAFLDEYIKEVKGLIDNLQCFTLEDFRKKNDTLIGTIKEKVGESDDDKKWSEVERQILQESRHWDVKFRLKLSELDKRDNELITDLVSNYREELLQNVAQQKQTDSVVQDLQAYHNLRVAELENNFRNGSAYPYQSPEHETLVIKLGKDLGQVFVGVMLDFLNSKIEKKETSNESQAVEESFQNYCDKMNKLINENKSLNDEELKNFHGQFMEQALEQLQNSNFSEINAKQLESRMEDHFVTIRQAREVLVEDVRIQAEILMKSCASSYVTQMQTKMEDFKTPEDITRSHDEEVQNAIRQFQLTYPKTLDPQTTAEIVSKLKADMAKNLKEIREFVSIQAKIEEDSKNEVVRLALVKFESGMDSRLQIEKHYIDPEELKEFLEEEYEKVKDTSELTEEQTSELRRAVVATFPSYSKKNDMRLNSNKETPPAIGIDLGTTYCCVAVYYQGKVKIIRNSQGHHTTPSYIGFEADGSEVVGEVAKNRAYRDPENTIFDAKRIIGRRMTDLKLQEDMKFWPFKVINSEGRPQIEAQGKLYSPEEISAILLRHLKREAEKFLKCEVTKAVITVPAYFCDAQRLATVEAGKLAGFEVLDILNEPTAAAIAYQQERLERGTRKVLVFDLGGGTFDVVVAEVRDDAVAILAADGDTHLGGEDFDRDLLEYCLEEFRKEHKINLKEDRNSVLKQRRDKALQNLRRLQTTCENQKKELSSALNTEINVDTVTNGVDLSVLVRRAKFEGMIADYIETAMGIVDRVLKSREIARNDIDDIILVGGSSRIPKVQQALREYFPGKSLDVTINPDEAVAYGAALHAAILNGAQIRTSFWDVTPMAYGIELSGGKFSVIIPKNTKIPSTHRKTYETTKNYQKTMEISIFQGNDALAEKNFHLGDLGFNIPAKQEGKVSLQLVMEVNRMGVLNVTGTTFRRKNGQDLECERKSMKIKGTS